MIMDFCEEGNLVNKLRELLNKSNMVDEIEVKKLIYDCTQGYKELQKHKIVHLDIKP